jgi:hypothetical protein
MDRRIIDLDGPSRRIDRELVCAVVGALAAAGVTGDERVIEASVAAVEALTGAGYRRMEYLADVMVPDPLSRMLREADRRATSLDDGSVRLLVETGLRLADTDRAKLGVLAWLADALPGGELVLLELSLRARP